MSECKHCHQKFEKHQIANHSRWCDLNPKASTYRENPVWKHKVGKKGSNQYTYGAQMSDETKKKLVIFNLGRKMSEIARENMRRAAQASTHRRLNRNVQMYSGVQMDSSWEVRLAKRLDSLSIKWIRPNPIVWTDRSGKNHHYFPDFYLPDFDLYLDPKNPAVKAAQREKLECLNELLTNLVVLGTIQEIDEFCPRIAPVS